MTSGEDLIARIFWVIERTEPFAYAEFESTFDCHHQTARKFLNEMVHRGMVTRLNGKGGRTARRRTVFFPIKMLQDRYTDEEPAVTLLLECLQLFHYTPGIMGDPIVKKVENFLKFVGQPADKVSHE